MSRYLQFNDDDEASFLSSNSGWSQFLDWEEKLPRGEFPDLANLCETGGTEKPQLVADEIKAALKSVPPIKDVKGIAKTLIKYLDGEKGTVSVV